MLEDRSIFEAQGKYPSGEQALPGLEMLARNGLKLLWILLVVKMHADGFPVLQLCF